MKTETKREMKLPANAVAEKLLGLLALSNELSGLHLLRLALRPHHLSRGAPVAVRSGADVSRWWINVASLFVVVLPHPTHFLIEFNSALFAYIRELSLSLSLSASFTTRGLSTWATRRWHRLDYNWVRSGRFWAQLDVDSVWVLTGLVFFRVNTNLPKAASNRAVRWRCIKKIG